MTVALRSMTKDDWSQVSEIYRQGIETGNATFETQTPAWDKWDTTHTQSCRIVATMENVVVGWAALIPVSSRKVYAGVGEVSIYISDRFKNQKIGSLLLKKLIEESEAQGFWTLQAGIFPENTASMKLHHNNGFRTVGYREKIGQMKGIWRNTMLLERRSKKVGTGPMTSQ